MSRPFTAARTRLLATLSLGALTLALWPALAQAQDQAPAPPTAQQPPAR